MYQPEEIVITEHAMARYRERISDSSIPDICRRLRQYWRDGVIIAVFGKKIYKRYDKLVLVVKNRKLRTVYLWDTLNLDRHKEVATA